MAPLFVWILGFSELSGAGRLDVALGFEFAGGFGFIRVLLVFAVYLNCDDLTQPGRCISPLRASSANPAYVSQLKIV